MCVTMYFILACSEPGRAQRQCAGCLPRTGELPCSGSGTQRRLERGRLCPAPQHTRLPPVVLGNFVMAGTSNTAAGTKLRLLCFQPKSQATAHPHYIKIPTSFGSPQITAGPLYPLWRKMLHYEGDYVKSLSNTTIEHLCLWEHCIVCCVLVCGVLWFFKINSKLSLQTTVKSHFFVI